MLAIVDNGQNIPWLSQSILFMSSQLSYDHVLFFGRTLAEYEDMFGLDFTQWRGKKVLDCPSGPSSFVAQSSRLGVQSIGCDPLYLKPIEEILALGKEDIEIFISQQKSLPHFFDQSMDSNPQKYCQKRLDALKMFAEDYPAGSQEGRYLAAALPELPFADRSFDLVLSANLLFFYSDMDSGGTAPTAAFDYDFHRRAIIEMHRVSTKEVRIYPLKGPNAPEHQYFTRLMADLSSLGIETNLQPVPYRGVIGAEHALCLMKR